MRILNVILTVLIFIVSCGNTDIKLEQVWVRQWGTDENDRLLSVTARSKNETQVIWKAGSESEDRDFYETMWDSNGVELWTKQWIGNIHADKKNEATDTTGNTYITGTIDERAGDEIYLVKKDASGKEIWRKQWRMSEIKDGESIFRTISETEPIASIPYEEHVRSNALAVDKNQNIFIAGTIGVIDIVEDVDGSIFSDDSWEGMFLSQFGSDGNIIKTKVWLGLSTPYDVIMSDGFLYMAGTTNIELEESKSFGSSDAFLMKMR